MISYMQCLDHTIMIKEALAFMMLNGNDYKTDTVKFGSTEITFTNSQMLIFFEDLQVGHIETLINLRLRLSIPEHLSFACFYTQVEDNNIGEIRKRADSLYTDTSQIVELVPKVSEEEWDSTKFQLSTLYDEKVTSSLMLEPFCTEELSKYYPTRHYRYKQYTHFNSWVNLPFELIGQDIYEMCTRYVPPYVSK